MLARKRHRQIHALGSFASIALFSAPFLSATTIVAIRTPTEVVIAADSASTIQRDGREMAGSVCKIYQLDARHFFAISGIIRDHESGFDVPSLVVPAGTEATTERILANLEPLLIKALLSELPHVKRRAPAEYMRLLGASGVVTVTMIGIDNVEPAAASVSIGLHTNEAGTIETVVRRDACPGNCPSGTRVLMSGETAAIEQLRSRGSLPNTNMPELAKFLVQAEIDAHAPRVAGPIDVLRVRPDGVTWIQRKASCPAVVPSAMK